MIRQRRVIGIRRRARETGSGRLLVYCNKKNELGERKMKRVMVLLAATLIVLPGTKAISSARAQQAAVNSDNLNQMIAAAKTPGDHEAIAVYYDQEGAANEKLVALHRASKNIYSKGNNQLHCNSLIKAYERAVNEDKALAAVHREMAKKAGGPSGQ